ncbi:MAG: hypothetical protein Q4A55_06165 [Aerococcus sp.]|nr:hypothetical protein [Aerococcus sp.]
MPCKDPDRITRSIRMSNQLKKMIKTEAKKQGVPMTVFILESVERHLSDDNRKEEKK